MPSFDFSEEQQQLVDTAREFAKKEIVPVAGHLDEEGIFPKDI
jgi:alkylation response protein AidB-like acyl-CoA dehydrogenase